MSAADVSPKSIGSVDRSGPAGRVFRNGCGDELGRLKHLAGTDRHLLGQEGAEGVPDLLPLARRSKSIKIIPATGVPKQLLGLILERDRKLPVDVVLANLKLVARHGHDNRLRWTCPAFTNGWFDGV